MQNQTAQATACSMAGQRKSVIDSETDLDHYFRSTLSLSRRRAKHLFARCEILYYDFYIVYRNNFRYFTGASRRAVKPVLKSALKFARVRATLVLQNTFCGIERWREEKSNLLF